MTTEQRRWLDGATRYGGSFVNSFARTCFAADSDNFLLLAPVLDQMILKYPKYLEDRFSGRKEGD